MKINTFHITGPDLSLLIEQFKEKISINYPKDGSDFYDIIGNIYFCSYDNIYIITTERYYMRVSSNLATTIIFHMVSKNRVNIKIISVGGGEGLITITLGSEGASTGHFIHIIKNICESHSWHLFNESGNEITKYVDEKFEKLLNYNNLNKS